MPITEDEYRVELLKVLSDISEKMSKMNGYLEGIEMAQGRIASQA
jgi:hypothetical protein